MSTVEVGMVFEDLETAGKLVEVLEFEGRLAGEFDGEQVAVVRTFGRCSCRRTRIAVPRLANPELFRKVS